MRQVLPVLSALRIACLSSESEGVQALDRALESGKIIPANMHCSKPCCEGVLKLEP